MQSSYTIAEIAQAHDGSLGLLHSYIDALSETGINAIKFQTHIADAESSEFEPFRVNFSYVDKTRFDYWKRMEFTKEQWKEIKNHCDKVNLDFISSPFSIAAVSLLEEVGMKSYKIASGEITNYLLLEKVARIGKPVMLSSGMSSFEELENAFNFLMSRNIDVSVMQCTTMYPTPPEQLGINVIPELARKFNCKVGFSDHSGNVNSCLMARMAGAEVFEFHAVFDKKMFGPDAPSSLTIAEIKELVASLKFVDAALANPVNKNNVERYNEMKKIFGKSLAVNKDLPAGHIISFDDLESKKPAEKGISAADFQAIIGKMIIKPISKYSFLKYEDIE